MDNSLEAELDLLFQALPSALVEARNALADRLRKAGDKAAAAQIKALKRPAPAAWALNQVHFRAPQLLERARAETATVRALHARDAVDPRALMAAHEAQRNANKAVVESALRYAEEAGLPSAAAQQRRVLATLQGLLTGASAEVAGRLTKELEPGGFDAIDSVGLAAPRAAPEPITPLAAPTRATPASQPHDSSVRAAAETQLRSCERAVREAEAIAHKRRSAQQRGQSELDEAREAAAAAERSLFAARAALQTREAEFQGHRAALEAAEADLRQARARLEQARRALHAL